MTTKSGRVWVVAAVLVAAAFVSSSHLRGDDTKKKPLSLPPDNVKVAGAKGANDAEVLLAQSKFDQGGILSYQTTKGDRLFAWQLKPDLGNPLARPRDYL